MASVQLLSDGLNIPQNPLEINVTRKQLADCFYELLKAQGFWETGSTNGLTVLDLAGMAIYFNS